MEFMAHSDRQMLDCVLRWKRDQSYTFRWFELSSTLRTSDGSKQPFTLYFVVDNDVSSSAPFTIVARAYVHCGLINGRTWLQLAILSLSAHTEVMATNEYAVNALTVHRNASKRAIVDFGSVARRSVCFSFG